MRRTWVYVNGIAYEKGTEPQGPLAPDIMPDIKPYKSMITGEMITSREKHREHLRRHGYTEIGNDRSITARPKNFPEAAPQRRKELLIAQVQAMTHEQFKAAGKRDLERLRWNTRDIPDPLKEI